MPFWQAPDTFHDDPIWAALAEGDPDELDRLQAAWCRLLSYSARHRTNGYGELWSAVALCHHDRSLMERLLEQPLATVPPLLHQPEDDCSCTEEPWPYGWQFRLHDASRGRPCRG